MQAPNDNRTILLDAIYSLHGHYQASLENKIIWLFPLEYDASTLHLVNLFLKEHQFVYFNPDGTLKKMGLPLPEKNQLLTLITDYSYRYMVNRLASTQECLKVIAKLPTLPGSKKKELPGSKKPSQSSLTTKRKIKTMDHWDEKKFAESVRRLHEYYCSNDPSDFTQRKLAALINFQQFTTGTGRKTEGEILNKFNQFLSLNTFITLSGTNVQTIIIRRDLPKENDEVIKLFRKFKKAYYKRSYASTFFVPEVHDSQPKPAAVLSSELQVLDVNVANNLPITKETSVLVKTSQDSLKKSEHASQTLPLSPEPYMSYFGVTDDVAPPKRSPFDLSVANVQSQRMTQAAQDVNKASIKFIVSDTDVTEENYLRLI